MYAELKRNWLSVFLKQADYEKFMAGETIRVSYDDHCYLSLIPHGDTKKTKIEDLPETGKLYWISKGIGGSYQVTFPRGEAAYAPNIEAHVLDYYKEDYCLYIKVYWPKKAGPEGYNPRILKTNYKKAA